jgi:HYR domain
MQRSRGSRPKARSARVSIGTALLTLLMCSSLAAAADPVCVRNGRSSRPALMFSDDGRYAFCGCAGNTVTGSGIVTQDDNLITLEHNGPDYVHATIDTDTNTGSATLDTPLRVGSCDVEDNDVSNGQCACDFSCILSCPDNIRVPLTAGNHGARVWYREPMRSNTDACGEVTCSAGPGSIFARGTTVVRCATEKRAACNFKVSVD